MLVPMEQRYPIVIGGGPVLPGIVGTLVAAPAIGLYFRFIQHESWAVVIAVVSAVALIGAFAVVWGIRMAGKAIVISDEGISLPRLASDEPETIVWTGIEACERNFNQTRGSGPERFFELTYYGGRKRRIFEANIADPDALFRAIQEALARQTR